MTGMVPIFCICRRPDDGTLMLQCNYCSEWYHIRCVGLDESSLTQLQEYKCPPCLQSNREGHVLGGRKKRLQEDVASPPMGEAGKGREKRKRTVEQATPSMPSYNEANDPVRRQVLEGLIAVLKPFVDEREARKLAAEIEDALFATMKEDHPENRAGGEATRCGQKYRSKYRSLQFNLKDPKNDSLRQHLLSGEISPVNLVQLSPQEMANEEVAQEIRRVRQQSIREAVIEEGAIESGFVKKTHKGEEVLTSSKASDDSAGILAMFPTSSITSVTIPVGSSYRWSGKVILPDVADFKACGTYLTASTTSLRDALPPFLPHNLHISGRIAIDKASSYLNQIWQSSTSREVIVFTLLPATTPTATTVEGNNVDQGLSYENLVSFLKNSNRWAVIAHDPSRGIKDFYLATCSLGDDLDYTLAPSNQERRGASEEGTIPNEILQTIERQREEIQKAMHKESTVLLGILVIAKTKK